MGQLGKIFKDLKPLLREIGEENLQACYSLQEIKEAIFNNVDEDLEIIF